MALVEARVMLGLLGATQVTYTYLLLSRLPAGPRPSLGSLGQAAPPLWSYFFSVRKMGMKWEHFVGQAPGLREGHQGSPHSAADPVPPPEV